MFERGRCLGPEQHPLVEPEDITTKPSGHSECTQCLQVRTARYNEARREARKQARLKRLEGKPIPRQPSGPIWCRRKLHIRRTLGRECEQCAKFSPEEIRLLARNGNMLDVCGSRKHQLPDQSVSTECEQCQRYPKDRTVFSDAILMCGHRQTFSVEYMPDIDEQIPCTLCPDRPYRYRRVIDNQINEEQTAISREQQRR